MELFLLRHGSAVPDAARDCDRVLNAVGREEARLSAQTNAEALSRLTHVLVSPYARAQQTCDIVLKTLGVSSNVALLPQTVDFLTPCSNPQSLLDYLYQMPFRSSVLCVAHQPLLGTLLDEICAFEPGQYRMGTGALAYIHFDEVIAKGLGSLQWLQHP